LAPVARILPADFVSTLFRLDGRVAAVCGGGSGLGAAMAAGLAQAGAAVAVVDVKDEGARATVEAIEADGGRALAIQCDITDSDAANAAADRVVAELGSVDVLVNSAGIAFRSPAEEFPEERFDAIIAVNLKGTYLACQSFGRKMLERRTGSVINVASIGGFVAYPHASAYLASKGGVVQLTKALALEWVDRRVRVNAIAPTLFRTPLTEAGARRSTVTSDFIRKRLLRQDRLGEPQELVGAAVFLASDASTLVTGHTLAVDDGYLIA
jgi:NAD(P)-dependent dehydrogenase (short-subunit alcohol dehydrogenase family)